MDPTPSASGEAPAVGSTTAAPSAFDNVEPEDVHRREATLSPARQALDEVAAPRPAAAAADDTRSAPSPSRPPAETEAARSTLGIDSGGLQLSMKDLFGPFFHVPQAPAAVRVADPALLDTRAVLEAHFGAYVRESDVRPGEDAAVLAAEMRANQRERQQALVQQIFGVASPAVLSKEDPERFTLLRASLPRPAAELEPRWSAEGAQPGSAVWLLDMPKTFPNRQILHADPQPFFASRCPLLESDSRSLYTPQNVLRWAHHKGTNTFMSNARVVRWSDGSSTLHVGSDMYTLDDAKGSAAVHLLGTRTSVAKGRVTLPSITKTVHPDRHFVVGSAGAVSVERAIVAEAVVNRTKAQSLRLAYATTPLPEVDWAKPSAARNPMEEYVAMAYEQRSRELLRRAREGRPMTLREQLEADAQLYEELASANVDELVQQQREEKRQAALQAPRGGAARRGRLERDTGLAALTGGGDPFMADGDLYDFGGRHRGSGDEDDDDDDDDEDIEAMMERMRAKREREEANAADGAGDEDDELLGITRRAPRYEVA